MLAIFLIPLVGLVHRVVAGALVGIIAVLDRDLNAAALDLDGCWLLAAASMARSARFTSLSRKLDGARLTAFCARSNDAFRFKSRAATADACDCWNKLFPRLAA